MKMRLMQKKISSSGIARLSSHFISRSFINQNESHPDDRAFDCAVGTQLID